MLLRQTPPPTIPVPPPPPGVQDVDVATLQSQLGSLRVEFAGLQAQWNGLKSQLDNMLRSNPARPGVQQQWADVGVRMARVEGDIASLQARIALQQGRPIGVPGAAIQSPWARPDIVVPAVSVVSLTLLLPLAIGWARRMSRRAPAAAPIPSDLKMRLDRIENAVETIAIEVERVSEGQRFVTKVLAGRPAPAGEQASEQPKQQPLALGAGEAPLQPIVVPERDRVGNRPAE